MTRTCNYIKRKSAPIIILFLANKVPLSTTNWQLLKAHVGCLKEKVQQHPVIEEYGESCNNKRSSSSAIEKLQDKHASMHDQFSQ
jgi:hypothetical protein